MTDAIGPRYRALILVAVFGSLRWGELAALRRCDIDLRSRTIRIERSLTELPGGGYLYGPPKSEGGKRRMAVPAHITADLKSHLADFVGRKITTLQEAFTGSFTDHHAFLLAKMPARVDAIDADLAALDERIEQMAAPFAAAVRRLTEIPGINITAACPARAGCLQAAQDALRGGC